MRSSFRLLLLAFCLPSVAIAQGDAETEEPVPDSSRELSPEEAEELFRELEEHRRAFAKPPVLRGPEEESRDYSGEWIEENGGRSCDGYLTRSASEEYCSREIPDDWRSFEFDGETYYVAPLKDKK